MQISRCVIEAIQRAAADAAPREACGMLFGEAGQIDTMQVVDNVSQTPETQFEIDPVALFAALRFERAGRAQIAGYWHSHPSGDARPSATDVAMAAGDGKLWLIVAGKGMTLWRSGAAGFESVELSVE